MKHSRSTIVCAIILLVTLVSFSPAGIIQAVIPQVVPTLNRQGSTGTKFFICATGSTFTAGNAVTTDASGNCIDGGTTPGGGGGIIPYSSDGGLTLTAGTYYFPFGGGGAPSTTEADVQTLVEVAGSLQKFALQMSASIGGGNAAAFTVRDNAADTAITCTASAAATCNDSTHSINTTAGHLYDVKLITTGTVTVTPLVQWTLLFGAAGILGPTGPTGPTGSSGGGGGGSTPVTQVFGAASSTTVTSAFNVATGDMIVLGICNSGTMGVTIASSHVASYTLATSRTGATNGNVNQIWYGVSTGAGSEVVTVTGASGANCGIINGVVLTGVTALDTSVSAAANVVSITTANANEVIVVSNSGFANSGVQNETGAAQFLITTNGNGSEGMSYFVAGAARAWEASLNTNDVNNPTIVAAAFH